MKYKRTEKELGKFSELAIEKAQLELGTTRTIRGRKVRRVAKGTLGKSLFSTIKTRDGRITMQFRSKVDYADFVHEGVNGTRVKVGSKYSFKKKNINTQWVETWMRDKRIRLTKLVPGKGRVFVKDTEANRKAAAFVIGRSIAQRGIVGVPFMKLGVEAALKKFDNRLLDAIELDLNEELGL